MFLNLPADDSVCITHNEIHVLYILDSDLNSALLLRYLVLFFYKMSSYLLCWVKQDETAAEAKRRPASDQLQLLVDSSRHE
jgi:putative ribosome biogenesis GTPase RsgA